MVAGGSRRGFVLLVILVLLATLAATAGLTLREAAFGLRAASGEKSAEVVHAVLAQGLAEALDRLEKMDPAKVADPAFQVDIFKSPARDAPLFTMPPSSPGGYDLELEVGLRPGQRTLPPPGEDVRTTYGYVVEVQIQATHRSFASSAEERVAVGVRLPAIQSHSE